MSLIPWRGKQRDDELDVAGSPMGYFRSEMDRLFDRFFGDTWAMAREGFGAAAWAPSIDVAETDTEITIRAEVPGIDAKDIDISLTGQTLTVSGEKKETTETKGANYYRSERRFGSFRRSLQLPTTVDPEKVSATQRDGILMIRLQKRESAVPKRIPVKPSD